MQVTEMADYKCRSEKTMRCDWRAKLGRKGPAVGLSINVVAILSCAGRINAASRIRKCCCLEGLRSQVMLDGELV
jgi:hypothetical protein